MSLHGPPPCHKLGHHHQRPTGMKAPQPPSGMDVALHVPAKLRPQTPCRGGSASMLPQRAQGQASTCLLLRHKCSHRRDEPPQHSWLSSMVVIPHAHAEATSIKWPWDGSSMRCSHPTHKHSHIRGRQQQQHRSLPQRGPIQSKAHPHTPSRSPSRLVLSLQMLPHSQLIGRWLPHSSSYPQLQLH